MRQTSHGGTVEDGAGAVKPERDPAIKIRPRIVTVKGQVYHYWAVDLGQVDRKRKIRTFKSKAEAEREVERVTKQRRRVGLDAFRLSEDQLRDAVQAIALLKGARLTTAAEFFLKHGAGEAGEITVADLVAEFIDRQTKKGLAPKTIADSKARLSQLVKACGATKAHQVTVGDVEPSR